MWNYITHHFIMVYDWQYHREKQFIVCAAQQLSKQNEFKYVMSITEFT